MKTTNVRARGLPLLVPLVFGLWQAWHLRFVQDDAYISFRYAENFARGFGLVWNKGERVEGYTNFLWTLIMTIPHATRLNVELFAIGVGLMLFATTLSIVYYLVERLTESVLAAMAATLVLAIFPSFAAYATGGLETQLQTCLVTASFALVVAGIQSREPSRPVSVAIGTTSALAVLTRMDSIVILMPLIVLYVWMIVAGKGRRHVSSVAPSIVVPVVICGGWLLWKLAYYGSVLPNTYYAKVEGTGGLIRQGLHFIRTFVEVYAFYLPIGCVPIAAWLAWERRLDSRLLLLLAAPISLWLVYVVRVGADFMEYRFLVPALPLMFLATYWITCRLGDRPVRTALLTSIVLAGGIWNYWSSDLAKPPGPPLFLPDLVVRHDTEWYEIGKVLGEAFEDSVQPSIAVVPAGVIPYLSRLPAVDMMGLNDPEVRDFVPLPEELVGHRRLAPLELLERRKINFLLGHPVVRTRSGSSDETYRFADFTHRPFAYPDDLRLKGRQVIEVPLSRNRVMFMLYLTENAEVTARIDRLGWRRYPLL